MRPPVCQAPGPCCLLPKADLEAHGLQIPHTSQPLSQRSVCLPVGVCGFANGPASSQSEADCLQIILGLVSRAPGLMAGCLGSRTEPSFLSRLAKADSCLRWDKVSKEHSVQGGFFQWLPWTRRDGKLPFFPFLAFLDLTYLDGISRLSCPASVYVISEGRVWQPASPSLLIHTIHTRGIRLRLCACARWGQQGRGGLWGKFAER